MPFIHDDFLLTTAAARRLYHEYAAGEPIIDYHCHLPPGDVADNRQFQNLCEIWLDGDHYKWRAMRANGVPERFCTGDADPYDKFLAWASTVPYTLRNPLYHWTHLELQRYFQIEDLLNADTAPAIWEEANRQLASRELSAHGILNKFQVHAVCTTDDPTDSLESHQRIAASQLRLLEKGGRPSTQDGRQDGRGQTRFSSGLHLATRVYPTFRPDKALTVDQPELFRHWVSRLEAGSSVRIANFESFLQALDKRHDDFHQLGGRLSDHGLERCFEGCCDEATAAAVFDKAMSGQAASPTEHDQFCGYLMLFFGRLDVHRGWTKQLHLGALRNANSRAFEQLGPDTGFDSIGDVPHGRALARMLDRMDRENALPKLILYNLNPADNYLCASMLGNFQDGSTPGKLQFGSGWWFLDQQEAMQWQLSALSNLGLLSRFVGMLTDSRSFMSYPRHEYFRRTLCNLLGRDIEQGLVPNDEQLLGQLVRNICYGNAKEYFGLEI